MENNNQGQEAVEKMTIWLSHENELGKAPAKIEVAGEFDYDGNHYYILKYKKNIFSKWLVGVCGFDADGDECGHTFSEFEPYNESTAQERCIAMVEYMKEYWRSRFLAELERLGVTEEEWDSMSVEEREAKKAEASEREQEMGAGQRQGFILLESASFDFEKLIADLDSDWGFEMGEHELKNDNLVFHWDDVLMAVSLIPAPVPEKEAEHYAAANYLWREAVETTKRHQAHLIVFAINDKGDAISAGALFSMLISSCINQKEVLGIYTGGTVYEPAYYKKTAAAMEKGELPVLIWVYVGLAKREGSFDVYTYGMDLFGKPEMEILGSVHSAEDLLNFMYGVIEYVIKTGMTFRDGETLSFCSDEHLTVTRSEAVYVDGESLKIAY